MVSSQYIGYEGLTLYRLRGISILMYHVTDNNEFDSLL